MTGDVGMVELSGWEYGTRTREMTELLGGDDLRALGKLGEASGAFRESADLVTLASSFTALSASAAYSPLDKQVLIVDKAVDGFLLTHEFVHALQDQHFDLLQLLSQRPFNFDRAEALFALIEGDAVNVERRAAEGQAYSRKPLDDIAREEEVRFSPYRREMGTFFPALLTESFIFRYRDGARFVEATRRRGGERAINDLFMHPPSSSAEILHPEKHLGARSPVEISLSQQKLNSGGWHVTASTPFGEIGVRGLLLESLQARNAQHVAAGWSGDQAFLCERPGSAPLFVWKTVWENAPAAREFFEAYNTWYRYRDARPGAPAGDGAAAETTWQEGGKTTRVLLTGKQVWIVRGAEQDLAAGIGLLEP